MPQKKKTMHPRTSSQQYAALLEAMREEFKVLAEGQRAIRDDLRSFKAEITARVERLERIVLELSAETRMNREGVARLEAEVRRMDRTLQGKIDQPALEALEKRVAALESRLGIEPA